MNQYLKKAFIVSASILLFLSVGAGINNVHARRYHYRYHRRSSHNKYGYWKHYRRHGRRHSYFVRYKTGYYHNSHWIRYHRNHGTLVTVSAGGPAEYISNRRRRGHSRFKVHFRKISSRRHGRRYHIDVEGVNGGWTNNYNYYKLESAKIQNAINVQTAKDEEAEGLNPNQINNTKHQHHHGHSHFRVKFRKISGPSDDDITDTAPTTQYQPTYHSKINTVAWRQAVASDEFKLITDDRAQHNKAPLQEDPELDALARMRAKQTYDSNAMFKSSNPHIDPATGQLFDNEDAQQLGYTNLVNTMGENLAGGVADNSPKETAKEDNDMLYTQEEPYDGGHYQNIIGEYNNSRENENYLTVGVGAYGNVLAEDFSFGNPDETNNETPFEQRNSNDVMSEGHWTGQNTYSFPNGIYDVFNAQRTHVTVHIPGQGIRQY